MKTALALAAILIGTGCAWAQKPGQVAWSVAMDPAAAAPGAPVEAKLDARLEPGWHIYSGTTQGAIPLSVQAAGALEGARLYQPPPHRSFDPNFNAETETYEGQVAFVVRSGVRKDAIAGPAEAEFHLRYQTCNDKVCVPGRAVVKAALTVDPGAKTAAPALPAGYAEAAGPAAAPPPTAVPAQAGGMAGFLLVAFGFGLAAIFTPCVFPMIPITVSFFLNRQAGTRRDSLFQAVVFCLGIIVLFSGLGLLATAILGPFGVVQLGSNPWVNGFIALVFLLFGLSLLGAFEITVPSAVLTRLDRASQGGGVAGTLLMGLTFSLTSFACVGPFVGTLLAASVQGGGIRPLAGMASFATGLALPFFLLALFPSYLKRLPRSGGWMARVKVVMGFVILAAMLKYLSSLDQVLQWNVLTRERFLAAWVVLFAMPGLYLLGWLPLEGIKRDDRMGLGRLLTGMAFLIFSISLLPGMFGARLGELDAYVPLAAQAPAGGGGAAESAGIAWMKNDYQGALDKARREGKLVFVSFTGYACTNCHWMKANMFTRPEIAAAMAGFVPVELYTDGTDAVSQANQQLQETKFATVAIPYYAIVDPDGNVVASFPGLTKNPQEYLAFLKKGEGVKAAAAPTAAITQSAPADPIAGAGKAVIANFWATWYPDAYLALMRDQGRATPPPPPAPPAPPLTTLDGSPFDTAALRGKPLVVNFWATWCVPCAAEIPSFNKLHDEYSGKGVAVIGVSMDEDGAGVVKSFLSKHPMKYTVAMGSAEAGKRFGVGESLPVTLVFDRAGKQLQRFEGFTPEAALAEAVRKAL